MLFFSKTEQKRKMQNIENIPGSLGFPFLGETVDIFKNQEFFYYAHFLRYGSFFKTRLMGMNFVVILSPEGNQLVLKDQEHKFSANLGWKFLEPLLGDGLLRQDGEQHRRTRQLLYPSFGVATLNEISTSIQQVVEDFIKGWNISNPVSIFDELRSLTLAVSCRIFLGSDTRQEIDDLSKNFIEFIDGMKRILRINAPFSKYSRAMLAKFQLEKYILNTISSRRASKNSRRSSDILDVLLDARDENGCSLNDPEIVTQVIQLLFGSHESVSFLLTWMLYELSESPQWLDLIRSEVSDLTIDNIFTYSSFQNFQNLNLVLQEIERLYPPAYFIPRGVIEDFEFKGYKVSSGWYVMLCPFVTNRLPEIYSDPNNFDPNRFSVDREEHRKHPYAFISYGGGAHQCLGKELARLEIKIIMTMILQKFNFDIYPSIPVGPILHPRKWHRSFKADFSYI
jgi:retinoid hydroxylase